MNFRLQNYFVACAAALLLSACDTDISGSLGEDPSSGSADFSTFVTVGDSLTAGYADGTVYRQGQINSFPAIMAQQFELLGGGAFAQPLRPVGATGSFAGIPKDAVRDRLVLVATGNPERPVTPAPIVPAIEEILVPMPGMAYNNIGVPAAKSIHVDLASYGNPAGLGAVPPTANPFYVRMATNPGVSTMLGDASMRAPTFFVLWIGNNDILLNAVDGSPGTANPVFGTAQNEVTPTATFEAVYPTLVDGLKTATNKGVLINIPRIDTIPYFTTVPYNAVTLDADQAAALNADAQLIAYNTGMDTAAMLTPMTEEEAARRKIVYKEGENPILIIDDDLFDLSGFSLPDLRPATAQDLILLPAAAKIGVDSGGLYGIAVGLADEDVLTATEAAAIEGVRMAYNTVIENEANADPDILLFDVAALLDDVNDGFSYGSGGVSSAFIQGGAFSLDGIHPTAKGYAVIANEIFKVINNGFDAYIPPVDPDEYTTVFYQK